METVGFIGLGAMGGPVAGHIQRAGYPMVVYDVRDETTRSFGERGATVVDSAAALARTSDVIITALPMPEDVEQVACGRDGIIEGIKPGSVYLDISTSPPSLIRRLEPLFRVKGASVLDAPVASGQPGAARGIHEVMVGGQQEIFERVKPILSAFGDQVLYAGPLGSGSICKLVHQMIGCAVSQALAEGLSLGVKAGVEPKILWDCVRRGMVGRMHVLHYQVPQTVFRGTFETDTFPLKLLRKDVGLATDLGRELNVPLALANIAEQSLVEAINRGWGDKAA
jgi:3-hydroxyisobutyrate dehydrogenase-like beta-hydroxyacid dehydrogenase